MGRTLTILLVALAGCARVTGVEVPPESTALGPQPGLPGSLTTPAGPGPFPVAVLLHGCSGLQRETSHQGTWRQLHEYAAWYAARGFAALVLDSFESRRVRNVCTGGEPGPTLRALDVYRALDYLGRQGRVDPARAVAQGLSHGGTTVLAAMDERVLSLAGSAARLRGGIAYYPSCSGALARTFYGPVLILIGDKDDWTPAAPCESLHSIQEQREPGRVRLTVYSGATHSFDFNSPPRVNEYGKHLAFDSRATRDAERRVGMFLDEVVGKGRGQ